MENKLKISIIGGGNMGGAIARGLSRVNTMGEMEITVIDINETILSGFGNVSPHLHTAKGDYSSLKNSDIVIVAVKPWLVESLLTEHRLDFAESGQVVISIASGITIEQLESLFDSEILSGTDTSIVNETLSGTGTSIVRDASPHKHSNSIFRLMPNTAISVGESMSFVTTNSKNPDHLQTVVSLFEKLVKVKVIDEKLFPAATAVASCGIAFAFRYIRASMEGAVELGLTPDDAKATILQTLRGAVELLEQNGSHPEAEIDKVTTAGGITIKGLNELEHNGFSSSVIKALKVSANSK